MTVLINNSFYIVKVIILTFVSILICLFSLNSTKIANIEALYVFETIFTKEMEIIGDLASIRVCKIENFA